MSVVFESEGYIKTNIGFDNLESTLFDERAQNKHRDLYDHDVAIEIRQKGDSEYYVSFDGRDCRTYIDDILPKIRNMGAIKWMFMTFCDLDFTYDISGNLGEGEFSKIIFSSKARKQFNEIYESQSSIDEAIKKIEEKMIKVKYR